MLTIILTTMVTVTLTAMFSLGAWAIKRLIDNAKEESVRTRTELTTRMDKLEARMDARLEATRTELRADMQAMETKMDARMAKIEDSVTVLTKDHSRLEHKLDTRMAKIEDSVASLTKDHSRLEGKLDSVLTSQGADIPKQPHQPSQT